MAHFIPEWVETVRRTRGAPSRLGTSAAIDAAARKRGLACVEEGRTLSLSRPVQSAPNAPAFARSSYELTNSMRREGRLVVARDYFCVDNHGMVNTHIDGLNHFGLDETWHDGSAAVLDASVPSVADWADMGLVTRAVFLDIPTIRGTPFVAPEAPVGANDMAEAVRAAGVTLERGDAIILYMGRDAYEPAHGLYDVVKQPNELRPGIGKDGAHWLSEQDVSMVLWDFMEACGEEESPYTVHCLIWAMGLILIDNCHLGHLRAAFENRPIKAGLAMVAPLKIAQATGCLVNPLLMI